MRLKKYKKLIAAGMVCACVLVAARIGYVTRRARLPKQNKVAQVESLVYDGVSYRVTDAVLYDYEDFFRTYSEAASYQEAQYTNENCRILLVSYTAVTTKEEYTLGDYIPLQFFHTFNGDDIFLFEAMNPSLPAGTFHSGDTILMPYEIYRENVTEKQWELVDACGVTYEMVFGSYPVKNCLQISKVRKGGES